MNTIQFLLFLTTDILLAGPPGEMTVRSSGSDTTVNKLRPNECTPKGEIQSPSAPQMGWL